MKLFRSIDLNRNLCSDDFFENIRALAGKPQDPRSINLHVEAHTGDDSNAELVERIAALEPGVNP